jgi:cob(I)alamin adenosyltransferase
VKIYTRTGDDGETSLFGGSRVSKHAPRIDAYGTIDELNSFLGVARAAWPDSPVDRELERVQADLFDIGAQLAAPGNERFTGVDPNRIEELEKSIDEMERELEPLKNFILPGGTIAAAHLHVARTVCRRAERHVVALGNEAPFTALAYLNRLSDFLFVSGRYANRQQGADDVPWKKT